MARTKDTHDINITEIETKGQEWYGLTAKQSRCAALFLALGNMKEAARRTPIDYRTAKRLLVDNEKFQALLNEFLERLMIQDAIRARLKIVGLMQDGNTEKIQFDAAKLLMERFRTKPTQVHEYRFLFGKLTTPGLEEKAVQLLTELKLIDGTAKDITPHAVRSDAEK